MANEIKKASNEIEKYSDEGENNDVMDQLILKLMERMDYRVDAHVENIVNDAIAGPITKIEDHVSEIERAIVELKREETITAAHQASIQNKKSEKVTSYIGVKNGWFDTARPNEWKKFRTDLYAELSAALNKNFNVPRYTEIKEKDFDKAIDFIEHFNSKHTSEINTAKMLAYYEQEMKNE